MDVLEQAQAAKKAITPNEKQMECIKNLVGSVMVLAGPGTGKTFTIIQRIKYMLEQGIKPDSILCLTFSDAAAGEMRTRLIKEMGVLASSVDIYTYHSFCNDIIKQNPMQFDMSASVKLITDTLKQELMKETLDQLKLEHFVAQRADKYHFAKDFVNHIQKIKSLRINKENYLSYLQTNPELLPRLKELEDEIYERESKGETRNKGRYEEIEKIKAKIEKAKELWSVYEIYSQKMLDNNLIDFSDMINFVLDAFESDKQFLTDIANKYSYFLVDEYQDTNALQNGIIFNLVEGADNKNIFVVGDDDQIIYGFQGAKSDNIENYLTHFPDTKVICLSENNRSTQTILDLSYMVVNQDPKRLENNETFKRYEISKKLTAKNESIISKEKKVRRWQFGEALQEYNHIVDDIENLTKSPQCPEKLSEIAIISKKKSELEFLADLLQARNIPFQLNDGKSIFSIRSSILIYFYLKALVNPALNSDKLFGLLLSEPFNIDLEDYNKILHENKINKKDFLTNMRNLNDWKNEEKIDGFIRTFDNLKEYASTNSLRNSVVEIINRTGALEFFFRTEKNKAENIAGIKKIIDEATELSSLDPTVGIVEFVSHLDSSLQNEIDIATDKSDTIQNAIQLVTYHGSKGREFEYVYLPNLIAKNWEKFSMPGEYKLITESVLDKTQADEKKDSELLKLLFVGITRAKHSLTLSFSDKIDESAQQITKYLADVDFDFDKKQFELSEDDTTREFIRSISREVYDNRKAFENEIKERIDTIVLSPSRVNDYQACPRRFFYIKVLGIDVEEADWNAANFGTAVHGTLETALRHAKETGSYPSLEQAKVEFEKILNSLYFTTEAKKEQYQKQGHKALEEYYPLFGQIPENRVVDVEFTLKDIKVGEDFISGKIDRIEKNTDGTYELYDYKTGKAKSIKEIAVEGKNEGYYNQLCFYKYAYEKMKGVEVSKVGLIFVEEHQKSVSLTLTNNDMEYIENLIKDTYKNIKALNFDPISDKNSTACKYCTYKQLCKLDVL